MINAILMTNPRYAYTNIRHDRISKLYCYYSRRIGVGGFPMTSRQRFAFDKIIVNLCAENELFVPYWVLNHPRYNFWRGMYWIERRDDQIVDAADCEIPYMEVKEEIKLINRMLRDKESGNGHTLTDAESAVFDRILNYPHCSVVAELMAMTA